MENGLKSNAEAHIEKPLSYLQLFILDQQKDSGN